MDLRFTEEEDMFRHEIRDYLRQELPPGYLEGQRDWETASEEAWAFYDDFTHKLGRKGWLAVAWPEEYGGRGWNPMQQLIFNEEMARHRAPRGDVIGLHLAGPIIIGYGNEEQKKQHLEPTAKGEVTWCQGFSEPNTGSDLASLETRAVEDGDEYVISGQKSWQTNAHRAQWCLLLARTDPEAPKHKGISYFLMDMKSPGITVVPVLSMPGIHTFNDVYLDEVRVPKSNLVGEENRGWYMAAKTIDFDRSQAANLVAAKRNLEELVQYAKETRHNGESLAQNPHIRHKLAELAIEIEVARMLGYRVVWMQTRGLQPNYEASIVKLYSSELSQRLANVGMQVMGLHGQLLRGSKWAPLRGRLALSYLLSVSSTIAAGTSEIQRLVIAVRGLGLPRG